MNANEIRTALLNLRARTNDPRYAVAVEAGKARVVLVHWEAKPISPSCLRYWLEYDGPQSFTR